MTDGLAWTVRDAVVEPGSKGEVRVPVGTLSDQSDIEILVLLANGRQAGPTLYVGAGVHGDEISTVAAAAQFFAEIDASALRGRIVCVPVQSPLAFRAHFRHSIQLAFKSPMDQYATDPFMHFPGQDRGPYGARVAYLLFELMRSCDTVLDLHTPTTGGSYVPFIFLPPPGVGGEIVERAQELAVAFGADYILKTDSGVYVGQGTGHRAAAEAGIPAFGYEVGEGGRLSPDGVRRTIAGLNNVLRSLEMLSGDVESLGASTIIRSMTPVLAANGGLWEVDVALGEQVTAGRCLGRIRGLNGMVLEEVVAPHSGPAMRITTFGSVASGERLVQIGVVE